MPFVSSVRGSYGVQSRRPRQTGRIGAGTVGGSVTQAGGYRIHIFSAVGTSTFVPDDAGTVEIFLIGGGGSGGEGYAGGGGAGGAIYATGRQVAPQNYSIVVGNGGALILATDNYTAGNAGGNSSGLGFTAYGGGAGAAYSFNGGNGGCGGGAHGAGSPGEANVTFNGQATQGTPSGLGISLYGTNGGIGSQSNTNYAAGGGGGIGGAGENGGTNGGNGGIGLSFSISGSSTLYGGGGGGGKYSGAAGNAGSGGSGIGGNGAVGAGTATSAVNGTGSGGGGTGGIGQGGIGQGNSGAGGSGIVIIRYPI